MKAHRLSMSRLGLARKCLYGFRGDVPVTPRVVGAPARIGSCAHNILARRVKPDLPEESYTQDERNFAQAIADGPVTQLIASIPWDVVEQGYRYNAETDTAELGPRRGQPGYEDVGPMVLPGTLDFAKGPKSSVPDLHYVRDLKTGKPPEDSAQLYGQAVAYSRVTGATAVDVAYIRALKTKCEVLNQEILDADRLDEEAGRIRGLLRMLPTSEPVPGDHCWKCDAWQACPAKEGERQAYAAARDEGASRLYDDSVRLFGGQ